MTDKQYKRAALIQQLPFDMQSSANIVVQRIGIMLFLTDDDVCERLLEEPELVSAMYSDRLRALEPTEKHYSHRMADVAELVSAFKKDEHGQEDQRVGSA